MCRIAKYEVIAVNLFLSSNVTTLYSVLDGFTTKYFLAAMFLCLEKQSLTLAELFPLLALRNN